MCNEKCGFMIYVSAKNLPQTSWNLPGLVNIQKAIEHCHKNSLFTNKKMVIFHSYVNVYQRAHGTPLKIFIPTFTGLLRRPQKWGYLWLGRIKEVFHDRCVAALWLPCSYVIQKWNNPLGGNLLTLQVSPIPIVTNSIWFHQTW